MLLPFLLVGCLSTADIVRHDPSLGDTADTAPESPLLEIIYPRDGEVAENPVTFRFEADLAVSTVDFLCDGWTLNDAPIPVTGLEQTFTYDFSGVNYERTVVLVGWDASGAEIGREAVTFIPDEGWLPPEAGFNYYVVEAINDTALYPKDETFPYCWEYYGSECGEDWGMIWGGWYLGVELFPGGGDCFCTGHTLEIFLDAYQRWQDAHGTGVTDPYGGLTLEDVDLGEFYQHWQGYGVAEEASAADAFEVVGIGTKLTQEEWPTATTGDFANLSRSTGTGHSVIFVNWLYEGDEIVGLRYYGCNGSGDSHPDPEDPDNISGISGPSFVSEYFEGHGGTVLPDYLYIGHPYDPGQL